MLIAKKQEKNKSTVKLGSYKNLLLILYKKISSIDGCGISEILQLFHVTTAILLYIKNKLKTV